MKKWILLGLLVGYVLGARAGRERYEQIRSTASRVLEAEPVRSAVEKLREHAGPTLLLMAGRGLGAAVTGISRIVHGAWQEGKQQKGKRHGHKQRGWTAYQADSESSSEHPSSDKSS